MNEHSRSTDASAVQPNALPEEYHIEATRSLVDRPLRILKRNDLFGVFDKHGDFPGDQRGPEGLYLHDTRFLSRLELRLGSRPPLLLGSYVLDDNGSLIVDLTNADLHDQFGQLWLARDTIFVSRLKFLTGNACYERISIRRFDPLPHSMTLELRFDADFVDLFEVRGENRPRRGTRTAYLGDQRCACFQYSGLDGVERRTSLYFDPPPAELTPHSASWLLDLGDRDRVDIGVTVACFEDEPEPVEPPRGLAAYRASRRRKRASTGGLGQIKSSNELFNEILARSASDVEMLLTATDYGLYPYAGVPWYSTIFGRDGIITALQLISTAPVIAKGVLRALALTQATETDPVADSQPGKILHEMRSGEMARLGEVPFRRYYGTIDATPLFILLAGSYLRRTGDLETIREIWPNIEAGLRWIDEFGDIDGDGFVEYQRMTEKGLANQGWKDSFDSVFHEDGNLAEGPIALCEVQAYVFGARKAAAEIALALSWPALAEAFDRSAEGLRRQFEDAFWIEDLGTYALALDGRKRPCRVLSSNAGHALLTGIASPDRAARVADLLMSPKFFSGWGVRTIATGQARYNPMSYHNGSIWPHDNALIALGLARYGKKEAVNRIFQALMEAASHDEFRRLPELFCGFARRRRRGPTAYPVACAPQAWAAAAPFALIDAAMGLDVVHAEECIYLRSPGLPVFIEHLTFPHLAVGSSRLTLWLARTGADVTTSIQQRSGPATLVIVK